MREIFREVAKKGRKTEFFWRYGFNFVPTIQYQIGSSNRFDNTSQIIIEDLNTYGIAISTVEDLLR